MHWKRSNLPGRDVPPRKKLRFSGLGYCRVFHDEIRGSFFEHVQANVPRPENEWMDYFLRVLVEDMAHYSRFVMDTLLTHPSVQDCKTSFVLDSVKATTAVPV